MSQTKYKMESERRCLVVQFCRMYDNYIKHPNPLRSSITKIIDDNRHLIGADILSDEIRDIMRRAIWHSTLHAKDYPYEVWNIPTISRNEFYERKRKFIYSIAHDIGI